MKKIILLLLVLMKIQAEWSSPPLPIVQSGTNFSPRVCCNEDGTAMALWQTQAPSFVVASFFDGTDWQGSVELSNQIIPFTPSRPSLCCNHNGKIFAIWEFFDQVRNGTYIQTNYFENGTWQPMVSEISDPSSGVNSNRSQICCNSSDFAIAVWEGNNGNGIKYSLFNGATWSNEASIPSSGSPVGRPDVCCDENGNAMVVWEEAQKIKTAYYDGTWHDTGFASGTGMNDAQPIICCDETGNALAVWKHLISNTLRTSYFNGNLSSWSSNYSTLSDSGVDEFDLCCSGNLNARVIWNLISGGINYVQAIEFNGSSLPAADPNTPAFPIDTIVSGTSSIVNPVICCSDPNKAVLVWNKVDNVVNGQIFSSFFFDGSWSSPEFISPPFLIVDGPAVCCTDNGAVAIWSAPTLLLSAFFTFPSNPPSPSPFCTCNHQKYRKKPTLKTSKKNCIRFSLKDRRRK